jgi:cephalosporin hydroxylase
MKSSRQNNRSILFLVFRVVIEIGLCVICFILWNKNAQLESSQATMCKCDCRDNNSVVAHTPNFSMKKLLGELFPPASVEVEHLPWNRNELCPPDIPDCRKKDEGVYDTFHGNELVYITSDSGSKVLTVDDIIVGYQRLFEFNKLYSYTNFFGVPLQQDPNDAFAIMDLLWRLKPDLLIELGTGGGGSTFFYATVMTAYNPNAHVISMDPMRSFDWNQDNVGKVCRHCVYARDTAMWKSGSISFFPSNPKDMVDKVASMIKEWGSKCVVVVDDSNHLTEIVRDNLRNYARFVTNGSYFLVQDMKLKRIWAASSPALPHKAVDSFLDSELGRNFRIDRTFEYYLYTQHARGWLRRVK